MRTLIQFAGALVLWTLSGLRGDMNRFLSTKSPKKQVKNLLAGWAFMLFVMLMVIVISIIASPY